VIPLMFAVWLLSQFRLLWTPAGKACVATAAGNVVP